MRKPPPPPAWPITLPTPPPLTRVPGWLPDPLEPSGLAAAWRALPWPGGRTPALVLWVPTAASGQGPGLALSSAFAYTDRLPPLAWPLPAPHRVRRQTILLVDAQGVRLWTPWALWTRSGVLGLVDPDQPGLLPPPPPTRPVVWRPVGSRGPHRSLRPATGSAPPDGRDADRSPA